MYEFRCNINGFVYYDPVVCSEQVVDNTLLFLLGYARVMGDITVSDKLLIPHYIFDSEGHKVLLPNREFYLNAREYLNTLSRIEVLDNGDLFELYGLTEVLESIGFYTKYVAGSDLNKKYNRVPHLPLFTKRSQDYKRIKDILTRKEFWNTDENPMPSAGLEEKYTIYNENYKGDRGEYLDLYRSFGSLDYLKTIYPDRENLPVNDYPDYCSWFIWDSLNLTSLYQISCGVLYGMMQLGWGMLPYIERPKKYFPYFPYIQLVDEAHFWFINTPKGLQGTNKLMNVDSSIFYYDTYTTL